MTAEPDPRGPRASALVEVDRRLIRLTTPDRPLWPRLGFTKRDLADYLVAMAPWILPHIRDRGLTLRRFPEGVEGPSWYQAQCRGAPAWMRTFDVEGRRGEVLRYCVVDDAAGLVWTANLANLELHPFLATLDAPDVPTQLVVDLDPGAPAGLAEACQVALLVREALVAVGLAPVVKTSGVLGIHVAAGLAAGHTFTATKAFARSLAERLEAAHPELVIARSERRLRAGRVLIDWLQNDPTRSTVAPYSLRAAPWPFVSMPLTWDEVAAGAARRTTLRFLPADAMARVERLGELFAGALDRRGVLPGDVVG